MTKTEKQFITDQLEIIDEKVDEDNLNRYATLLSVADLSDEVRGYLTRAVQKKREWFNPHDAFVVMGELDDVN